MRDLRHQDLTARQTIGLGQQAFEGIPRRQALVDALGQICPGVYGGTEFVALVVQGQQLLVACREANLFQCGGRRACRTRGVAAGAVALVWALLAGAIATAAAAEPCLGSSKVSTSSRGCGRC
jgi:hypothetical protein